MEKIFNMLALYINRIYNATVRNLQYIYLLKSI